MNYRIYFASGKTLDISEEDFNSILESGAEGEGLLVDQMKIKAWISLRAVDCIIPLEEGSSDIIKTPTPDILREQEKKKREAIISDPKKVLADIKEENYD